ncbi:hypothetical protein [Knoellia koreensis]|uniref:PKD domain-containing protein n=1 Tax=Knoellia koreensis TaxID=2730921 RepID=A0A849H6E3_9MICO|nr:hypothetical protein [Knoellia sp. DB2414S]NNM45390.1 hypothetical protein [Knoellia sp. DB2414S]
MGIASGAAADIGGDGTGDGVRIKVFTAQELKDLKASAMVAKAKKAPIQYEYTAVANCPNEEPGSTNADAFCPSAAAFCANNTPEQGLGPSVKLYRREVDAAGKPQGGWEQYGITCFPQFAPGASPTLTMELILAAFHDTKFAVPTVQIQPKGNVTLVTLPTYFQVVWPEAGFEPDEVDKPDPATVAGFNVEIRPVLKSVNYIYGDGSSSGPTESLGGPYPEGDVTKEYPKAGTFQVRADVTYGGQFRVNGGQWIDIPDVVVIQGTPEPLQVKTAKARLVTH